MTNRKTDIGSGIDLDSAELLILNGSRESGEILPDDLRSGMQNGTKVGMKPPPPVNNVKLI